MHDAVMICDDIIMICKASLGYRRVLLICYRNDFYVK